MPVNPHKYGSIPRLGLLKIDGSASDQNGDNRPRSRISDTDSEYVKMAKIGGHASELIYNIFKPSTFFFLHQSYLLCRNLFYPIESVLNEYTILPCDPEKN